MSAELTSQPKNQIPQIAENGSRPPKKRRPIETPTDWVKARRIASLFDCSEQAVYAGDYGLGQIRSVRLEAKRPGGKRDRRFYWPDAIAMKERLLDEATELREQRMGVVQLGQRRVRR